MGTDTVAMNFPWVGWRDVRLGARLAVVSVVAMVAARLLGLHAFYWAGISALIVSTGSPGGSLTAGLARLGGTVVGLGVGVGTAFLLGHSLLAAGVAIALAILVCQGVGLKAASKVGALTTLFPISAVMDSQGLGMTLATSFSRGENVLVGCAVALLLDWVLWPERPARRLAARLREDVSLAGIQAAAWLRAYVRGAEVPPSPGIKDLLDAHVAHAGLLGALAAEPEEREAPRVRLMTQVEAVHSVMEHCHALKDLVLQVEGDRVQYLLKEELEEMADRLEDCGKAFGEGRDFHVALWFLADGRNRLDAAYARVRGDKGTQAYPVQEIFHLVGVIAACQALERALGRLEGA
ncbi:MAG: hypothetical protein H6Q00_2413 [Holophagaceae bacterium]|nr:hypothetical protein [Holophagaceae bacterium]